MELDDQLAALVAGELDDDTARALRARAAADPAVARRLARHERLQGLLTGWQVPQLSEAAAARLDAVVDEALDGLGDEPLAARDAPTGPLTTTAASDPDTAAGSSRATASGVADLGAARRRREERRGLPAWLPGATVAAALLVVVGTGVVAGGGLFGGADQTAEDSLAEAPAQESSDESDDAEDMAGEDGATTGVTEADEGAMDDSAGDEMADEEMAEESAALGPVARSNVQVAEGDLLVLVETTPAATADSESSDAADEDADGAADVCVLEALERDTTQADGREVWQLAAGSYADRDAVFIVIRTPSDQPGDRYEVLAYDPDDCSLLARDETVR